MSTLDLHTIPYLFPLRPGHRELLESFSGRIQTKNFETAQHRAQLVAAMTSNSPELTKTEAWHRILEMRLGRSLTLQVESETVKHADGTDCGSCASRIGARYLCRLCAQGTTIEQPPHTDDFVCLRHQIFVGPGTTPRTQSTATADEMKAELLARKLRSAGRLDAALYTTLRDVFNAGSQASKSTKLTHRLMLPALVQLAATITSTDFRSKFFDPNTPFAGSYEYLAGVLPQLPSINPVALQTSLWLRYRPVFLTIRDTINDRAVHTVNASHELPGPTEGRFQLTKASKLEPFGTAVGLVDT
ncbi:MAG: hypothetical protein H7288_22025 [Kineosporiaceae bacterium]|nr:hypothetical protein [Aeromicrobium sp.]